MAATIVGTVIARPECWHELAALLGEQVAPTVLKRAASTTISMWMWQARAFAFY